MKKCPECGEIGDDSSIFCQNCGNKLENIENRTVKNTPQVTDSSFEKIQTIKIFGYSIIVLEIIVILGSWFHVKMINADRLMLYPLLCVIVELYAGFKLADYEETIRDSKIVVGVSLLLFVLSLIIS